MRVAVLYSGGKDSNAAVALARAKGWKIVYLLSVKPSRKDCYLFHYATAEHTALQAAALGLPHHLLDCAVADPKAEAELIKGFVAAHPVDLLLLGGTGLQGLQIRALQEALAPLGTKVLAAHEEMDHAQLFLEMVKSGYEIIITQVASDGLINWLGRTIDEKNFEELRADASRFGFHIGGEGGYFDSFVLDCPLFAKRIALLDVQKVLEDRYNGHLVLRKLSLVDK